VLFNKEKYYFLLIRQTVIQIATILIVMHAVTIIVNIKIPPFYFLKLILMIFSLGLASK
jgi:hypothetical protein